MSILHQLKSIPLGTKVKESAIMEMNVFCITVQILAIYRSLAGIGVSHRPIPLLLGVN
jgi:hypothetical protein